MSNPDPNNCPVTIREAFQNYRDRGVPPGGFVLACLENNLMEAFKQADENNREHMQDIVAWLYWEMPTNVYKSKENIMAHLASFCESPERERDEVALYDVSQRWDGGLRNRPGTEENP